MEKRVAAYLTSGESDGSNEEVGWISCLKRSLLLTLFSSNYTYRILFSRPLRWNKKAGAFDGSG
jgi:hypothetical protein